MHRLLFLLFGVAAAFSKTYFTTNPRGRLGNNLLSYTKALWLAEKFDRPCYFQHSKHLKGIPISITAPFLPTGLGRRKQLINYYSHINLNRHRIYEIHCGFSKDGARPYFEKFDISYFPEILGNFALRNKLRHQIVPAKSLPAITYPDHRISVALHIRRGNFRDAPRISPDFHDGDLENTQHIVCAIEKKLLWKKTQTASSQIYLDVCWPFVSPPLQYYLDQICTLYDYFHQKPLFIYLFTDDKDPLKIIEKLKIRLPGKDIVFSCNQLNGFTGNLVDDLFNMGHFDCFIRSSSTFAQFAQVIGHHKLIICPKKAVWYDNHLVVTKATMMNHEGREIFPSTEGCTTPISLID